MVLPGRTGGTTGGDVALTGFLEVEMSTPFAKDNAAHLHLGMQILLDLGEKYSTSIYTGTEVSSFLELSLNFPGPYLYFGTG
jgi:hypothetical protein